MSSKEKCLQRIESLLIKMTSVAKTIDLFKRQMNIEIYTEILMSQFS